MWYFGAWMFPIISACMWIGMLAALFGTWEAQGAPHLPSMEAGQHIAYISDVGAFGLKPLFITGSVITTVFLDLAFIAARWLRHYGRLAPNTSRAQSILSTFAIVFAIAGSCGLILLSIFDAYHHDRLHDGCLLLFLGGYIISAIFLCAEYQRLGIHYRQHRILRISFWVKLAFILTEIAFAVIFAATAWNGQQNIAAVFEWIVALIFTLYVLSFLLDLLPSVRTRSHVPQGWREGQAEKAYGSQPGAPLTTDSAGPNQNVSDAALSQGYRGTTMTNGHHPAGHADLGKQKRWGVGRLRF